MAHLLAYISCVFKTGKCIKVRQYGGHRFVNNKVNLFVFNAMKKLKSELYCKGLQISLCLLCPFIYTVNAENWSEQSFHRVGMVPTRVFLK